MKKTNLYYLSKVTLRKEKKNSFKIIFSLSTLMTLFIVVLYIVFSFFIVVTSNIKNDKESFMYQVQYSDSSISSLNYNCKDEVEKISGINKKSILYYKSIKYNQINIKIGDNDLELNSQDEVISNSIPIWFYDIASSDYMFNTFEVDWTIKNYGYYIVGEAIKNKNDVLVSSDFVENNNLSLNDVIGKKITISYKLNNISLNINNSTERFNIDSTLLENFNIVGVINSGISKYDVNSKKNRNPVFIFNADAYYNSLNYYYEKDDISYVLKYSDDPLKEIESSNNSNEIFIINNPSINNLVIEEIRFSKFNKTLDAYNILNGIILKDTGVYSDGNSFYFSDPLHSYIENYDFMTIILMVLLILFITAFLAALLNIYITIKQSIEANKKFININYVLGMEEKDNILLFTIQIMLYFIISTIVSTIISLAISVFITTKYNKDMSVSVYGKSLNLGYYPLALLFAILLIFGVLILIGLCAYKTNKKRYLYV